MHGRKLDRRVQFQRAQMVDDGLAISEQWSVDDPDADNLGNPVWAEKKDVSDAERWRASQVSASISTRFVIRWSSFAQAITPKDKLVCEGLTYEISGIKEIEGRHRWLELTCAARIDL